MIEIKKEKVHDERGYPGRKFTWAENGRRYSKEMYGTLNQEGYEIIIEDEGEFNKVDKVNGVWQIVSKNPVMILTERDVEIFEAIIDKVRYRT